MVTRQFRVLESGGSSPLALTMKTTSCSHCGISKDESEFPFRDSEAKKRHHRCSECKAKYWKKYYRKNRKRLIKKDIERVGNRRAWLRAKVNEAKNKPCADCGKKFIPYAMDFAHKDQKKKIASIKSLVDRLYSWERISAEIKKCDLLCATCHRIRTFNGKHFLYPKIPTKRLP